MSDDCMMRSNIKPGNLASYKRTLRYDIRRLCSFWLLSLSGMVLWFLSCVISSSTLTLFLIKEG